MHCSLMCTDQPTLKKRHDPIYQRQQVFADIVLFPDNLVDTAQCFKSSVTTPTVRTNNGSRFYTFLRSRTQTICSSVVNSLETDSSDPISIFLGYYKNQCFPRSSATTINWLFTTDVSFIDFYSTREPVAIRAHHCCTQFVQPCPSSLVTAKTQNSFESRCADTVFLVDYISDGPKPQPKRLSRILKYGARCYRYLAVAALASIKSPVRRPCFTVTAARAAKTIRPANIKQILPASFFGGKTFLKFNNCFRIIFHTLIL